MFKSVRQIEFDIRNEEVNSIMMEDHESEKKYEEFRNMLILEKDNIMSGWEVIASLSLEDQRELDLHHLPKAFKDVLNDYDRRFGRDHYSFIKACKALYRWDGENWTIFAH
jgi:hypothetical protein